MKGNKNVFVAVLIIISFLILWDKFVVQKYTPPRTKTPATAPAKTSPQSTSPPPKSVSKPEPIQIKQTQAQVVDLETEGARVQMTSQGAAVLSWQYKENGHWIELVKSVEPSKEDIPLPLETFPQLVYQVEQASPLEVRFVANHPDGFQVEKVLALGEKPWLHHLQVRVSNSTNQSLSTRFPIGWADGLKKRVVEDEPDKKGEVRIQAEMTGLGLRDEVLRWKPGFIFGRTVDKSLDGPFKWAGVDNNHFLAVLIPYEGAINLVDIKVTKKILPEVSAISNWMLNPGETKEATYQLYVGPKKMSTLQSVGHDLHLAVDFGFFGFIAKILLVCLNFLKDVTHNYGWAIIILSIGIQILFYPLTRKSLQHSARMKNIQPQLKKIREQFKNDPKRMNLEQMNLFRKNGMKFMGMEGCFPILIQMPVLFAIYSTFSAAYELRGAPWIFWVKDLSLPDPIFVLPVLMGAGMFLQQKLTSVAMDPAQEKMMMIMPIMMVFIFINLPAGLVLYWLMYSLLTIVVNKLLHKQLAAAPQPAAR